jgi:hypothetical protein
VLKPKVPRPGSPPCSHQIYVGSWTPLSPRRGHFVYVLEASFAFHNGLVIPLLSEFLEHALGDTEAQKQDCELRGFVRLSDRLKTLFPRLPILLLLDGLYANGPVMRRCLRAHWQFMIVLKDKDLSTVWQEFRALHALKPQIV